MQEEEQVTTTPDAESPSKWSRQEIKRQVLRYGILASAIACVFALIGTCLGAVNYISPTHYPVWVLALWLMVDVLLVLLLCLHSVFYFMLMPKKGILAEFDMLLYFGVAGGFIGAVAALIGRHFAWVSVTALFLLIGTIIANGLILIQRNIKD